MKMYFITNPIGFIPEQYLLENVYGDVVAVEATDDELTEYQQAYPTGKTLGVVDGRPGWVDLPPPTQEELVAAADKEKKSRINSTNAYMNGKQWPGKAAMGRLSDADKAQYNAWLDYLDALEAVDTSTAPDITWPVQPA